MPDGKPAEHTDVVSDAQRNDADRLAAAADEVETDPAIRWDGVPAQVPPDQRIPPPDADLCAHWLGPARTSIEAGRW
jgi:hypothetical protein